MSTKTKATIVITGAVVILVILAVKYAKKNKLPSTFLPVNVRAGAGAVGSDIPIATPQAITEAAYNQAANSMTDPIDDPNSLDDGVITLQ